MGVSYIQMCIFDRISDIDLLFRIFKFSFVLHTDKIWSNIEKVLFLKSLG